MHYFKQSMSSICNPQLDESQHNFKICTEKIACPLSPKDSYGVFTYIDSNRTIIPCMRNLWGRFIHEFFNIAMSKFLKKNYLVMYQKGRM